MDDKSTYTVKETVEEMIKILETETTIVLNWFNEMKSNDDKCHLIVANIDNIAVSLGNEIIESSNSVELLGVTIDENLNFIENVSYLCKKGNQKLHALARISQLLCLEKRKLIIRTFIESQFNYCPFVWMFFQELLDKDNSVTVHQRNLRITGD